MKEHDELKSDVLTPMATIIDEPDSDFKSHVSMTTDSEVNIIKSSLPIKLQAPKDVKFRKLV